MLISRFVTLSISLTLNVSLLQVVEKCIEAPGGSAVIDELLPKVYSLFDHPSGNYVVQSMVMKGDKTQVAAIRACRRPTPWPAPLPSQPFLPSPPCWQTSASKRFAGKI